MESNTVYLTSHRVRYILLEHMDGRPVNLAGDYQRRRNLTSMIGRGWIKYDNIVTPKQTQITMQGREALAMILGAWADELVGVESLPPKAWTPPVISDLRPGDIPRPL